jgi:hypothetical protein
VTGGASPHGGGIANLSGSSPTVVNCILWGNSVAGSTDETAQIYGSGATTVTYSCIQECTAFCADPNDHNIGDDPRFLKPPTDLRLSCGSPCIDAGDSTAVPAELFVDLSGLGRLLDDRNTVDSGVAVGIVVPVTVDMGAYEYHRFQLIGDVNGDDMVNFDDINPFVACLVAGGCPYLVAGGCP